MFGEGAGAEENEGLIAREQAVGVDARQVDLVTLGAAEIEDPVIAVFDG
ncbi:hypothetical protein [Sphingomonas sp. MMS24-J13]